MCCTLYFVCVVPFVATPIRSPLVTIVPILMYLYRSAELVENWTVRVTGTARETPNYYDPASRQRFRSRIAVAKFFRLMVRENEAQ